MCHVRTVITTIFKEFRLQRSTVRPLASATCTSILHIIVIYRPVMYLLYAWKWMNAMYPPYVWKWMNAYRTSLRYIHCLHSTHTWIYLKASNKYIPSPSPDCRLVFWSCSKISLHHLRSRSLKLWKSPGWGGGICFVFLKFLGCDELLYAWGASCCDLWNSVSEKFQRKL